MKKLKRIVAWFFILTCVLLMVWKIAHDIVKEPLVAGSAVVLIIGAVWGVHALTEEL